MGAIIENTKETIGFKGTGDIKETKIPLDSNHQAMILFGKEDINIKTMEARFGVNIVARGNVLIIKGDPENVDKATNAARYLIKLTEKKGNKLTPNDFAYLIDVAGDRKNHTELKDLFSNVIQVTARGRDIRAKTIGQKKYIDAVRKHGLTFAIGPAGTGKTYLAMAMATAGLKAKEYGRIVLTRPAVEAGESLGFLPGDLQEKVDPYLRPLYDALYEILGPEIFGKYMEKGIIEVAPLAYMRGRTLDDSFVILDEAQNTTEQQMKMFLTRLGFGSKAVVTGDITQIDLPKGRYSGLEQVQTILKGVKDIEFIYLTERDVVRHPLVAKIIKAYELFEGEKQGK